MNNRDKLGVEPVAAAVAAAAALDGSAPAAGQPAAQYNTQLSGCSPARRLKELMVESQRADSDVLASNDDSVATEPAALKTEMIPRVGSGDEGTRVHCRRSLSYM